MIYAFIAGHCSDLPVVACARVMKVSVSGFYEWCQRQANPCRRQIEGYGSHRDDHQDLGSVSRHLRQPKGVGRAPAWTGCLGGP